ncbi:MAG: transporter [Clostridiales bacterium]|nr:MAG: transporter [Clostridiales bacterium]
MNYKKAAIYMLTASFAFAGVGAVVKYSGSFAPLMQQVFTRNLIILFISYIVLKRKRIDIKPKRENISKLSFRCIAGFLGMVTLFYASRTIPLANAYMFQKLNAFYIAIFSFVMLKEPPSKSSIIAIIIAFAGAFIILNPTGNTDLGSSLIALMAGIFAALAYISIRSLAGKEEPMLIIFYFSLFSTLMSFPLSLHNFQMLDVNGWLVLASIGILAAIGQTFMTMAYTNAPAPYVSVFDYAGVIISAIMGLVFFGETITARIAIGVISIVSAGIINVYGNIKKTNRI